jgi:hypothetical protein
MAPLVAEGCRDVATDRHWCVYEVEHGVRLPVSVHDRADMTGGTVTGGREGVREMCCFAAVAALIGPRFGILIWWLVDTARWDRAFDNFFVAFVGFLFLPWTTIMYVATFPGGVTGFDWIWIGIGLLFDIGSYSSGGYSGRSRYAS